MILENRNSSWLTFKIYIPSQYLGYEEFHSFRDILENCIRVLTELKISPVKVGFKYYFEKEEFFKNPCIDIKTRSSEIKREWVNTPELSFLFLKMLELLDTPEILKEKMNKGIQEVFGG